MREGCETTVVADRMQQCWKIQVMQVLQQEGTLRGGNQATTAEDKGYRDEDHFWEGAEKPTDEEKMRGTGNDIVW